MTLKGDFKAWWRPSPEAQRAKYERKQIRNRRIEDAFLKFCAVIVGLVVVIYFIRHPVDFLWSVLIFGGFTGLILVILIRPGRRGR
jgi:Na+/H+ antiporter NhaD/arsenite permease-like protein